MRTGAILPQPTSYSSEGRQHDQDIQPHNRGSREFVAGGALRGNCQQTLYRVRQCTRPLQGSSKNAYPMLRPSQYKHLMRRPLREATNQCPCERKTIRSFYGQNCSSPSETVTTGIPRRLMIAVPIIISKKYIYPILVDGSKWLRNRGNFS
jgi:hypothetical protein